MDQITTTLRLLKNVDNGVTVSITAYVVSTIGSALNYQAVQFEGKNHAHLKDIVLSEGISEENLVVDIIIEADQYCNIAKGQVSRRGESGPVAINTRFGRILSGPVENQRLINQRFIQSIWQQQMYSELTHAEMRWTCTRWSLTRNSSPSGNCNQLELSRKKTLF